MSEAEVRLFDLLDKIAADGPGVVPISALQDACVHVPYLSLRLAGRRRYQLYHSLLLDRPTPAVPETFSQYKCEGGGEGGDVHNALTARLAEIFSGDELIDFAEIEGLVCYFSSTAACCFDEEMTGIILALATMIVDAELPAGVEKLRRLCQLFGELRKDFVAQSASRAFDGSLIPLLRLLLQYHDPHLSLHFDHHFIDIGSFILNWVRRLFVLGDNFKEALYMWDWLLIIGDPTMTVYFALAYLIAHRNSFFALQSKEDMTATLTSLVFLLPTCKEDAVDPAMHDGRPVSFLSLRSGKSLAQNADIAYRNTPRVTRRVIDALLFPSEASGINKSPDVLEKYYTSYTALPLERSDFAESFAVRNAEQVDPSLPSYIVIDCRARESFEFASLPTAVHVGDDIDFDNEKLDKLVLTLTGIKGAHLCVFGTGRPITDELNLLKMVSLHLVQNGFPYVSIGGFRTLLPLIKARAITITKASSGAVGWGGISDSLAALRSGITELLPHIEIDKQVAQRGAEELGSRAMSGVMAAKSWGWNVLRRVSERLGPGGAETSSSSLGGGGGVAGRDAAGAGSKSGNETNKSNSSNNAGNNGTQAMGGRSQRKLADERAAKGHFSLGVDEYDDEEDLDLIKSVPVYTGTPVAHHDGGSLIKGTPVLATTSSLSSVEQQRTHVDDPAAAPITSLPQTSALEDDFAAEIDGEFEKLFGEMTQ